MLETCTLSRLNKCKGSGVGVDRPIKDPDTYAIWCQAERPPHKYLPYCQPHSADFFIATQRHPSELLYFTMPWTSSIMPWNTSSHAVVPQRQNDEQPPHTGGRTTYLSTNNQDRSTFVADAPAGSMHAVRLAKIAIENQRGYAQAEETVQKKRFKEKSRQRLTLEEKPAQQQPRKSKGPSSSLTSRGPSGGYMDDGCQGCCSSSCNDHSTVQQHPRKQQVASPKPHIPLAPVYRYESDGHVTYHSKAPTGELMISAPQGSQEAQTMDYAASSCRATKPYPSRKIDAGTDY